MRIRWTVILLGLAIGLAIGLVYGLRIQPVTYIDTAPMSLQAEYKEQMTVMIAAAYRADGNLMRAHERLAILGYSDPATAVTALAQRTAAGSAADPLAVTLLSELAFALGVGPAPVAEAPTGQPVATEPLPPTLTVAPEPTFTPPVTREPPPPTLTPTPTVYDYTLASREPICDINLGEAQLQVILLDASGNPLPGVLVLVQWSSGDGRFYTGLKPELGLGYGDFTMTPGESYRVEVGALPVTDLRSEICRDGAGGEYWGSVQLVFSRVEAPGEG